jgi:hypothetical protein
MKSPLQTLFKDSELQTRFARDGFVVLPLLGATELTALREVFASIRPAGEMSGIYTNFHDNCLADNLRVDRVITEVFAGHLARILRGCELAGGSFFVKGTDAGSQSIPHQDWNCVDEDRHTSLNIWCPLIDVDHQNGTLQVVRGSHHRFDTVRSITIPSPNFSLEEIAGFASELPLRAGDAVIYAHDLFHGSSPNRSGRVRPVAVAGVLPVGAEHVHYYRAPGTVAPVAEVLRVDRSFYYADLLAHYSGARPAGLPILGTRTFDPVGPSLDELRQCTLVG